MSQWVKCLMAWCSSQLLSSGFSERPKEQLRKAWHWQASGLQQQEHRYACNYTNTYTYRNKGGDGVGVGIKGANPAYWQLSEDTGHHILCWGKTSLSSDFGMCLHNNSFKGKRLCLKWEFIWRWNKRIVSTVSLKAVRVLTLLMGERGGNVFLLHF